MLRRKFGLAVLCRSKVIGDFCCTKNLYGVKIGTAIRGIRDTETGVGKVGRLTLNGSGRTTRKISSYYLFLRHRTELELSNRLNEIFNVLHAELNCSIQTRLKPQT